MKQKYSFLLFIISIFLCVSNVSMQAQELMYLKQMYQRPEEGKVVNKQGQNVNYDMPLGTRSEVGKPWVVFSDRNYNKTYEEPNIASNLKNADIKFMERFYVVD